MGRASWRVDVVAGGATEYPVECWISCRGHGARGLYGAVGRIRIGQRQSEDASTVEDTDCRQSELGDGRWWLCVGSP